ncbi:hypothetical protein [Paracoccus sp. SSK6]|uniref:hypothetical protein n=1 Tax=Paracoccus sp. SSK6 TaxID=3143131 RepID=UPI003219CBA9
MIALGLAMKAKLEEPDPGILGQAVIAISETFPTDDPMRLAIKGFSDRFPLARRNPAMLRQAGEDLFGAVMRASWPAPSARADLEG